MAKISDMKEPRKNNAYALLFGDSRRGALTSQTHAAAIRMGNELQKHLVSLIPQTRKTTIDKVAKGIKGQSDIEVVTKPRMPKAGEDKAIEPDFAIFYHAEKLCKVIELKLGDVFDTQKSQAAKEGLQKVTRYIAQRTGYNGEFYLCSFMGSTPEDLINGLKNSFNDDQVMLFPELCTCLGVDYEYVIDSFIEDQRHNCAYWDEMAQEILNSTDEDVFFQKMKERKTGQPKLFYDED